MKTLIYFITYPFRFVGTALCFGLFGLYIFLLFRIIYFPSPFGRKSVFNLLFFRTEINTRFAG